jgi:hypothetical protein
MISRTVFEVVSQRFGGEAHRSLAGSEALSGLASSRNVGAWSRGRATGGPFQELCRAELISRSEIGLRSVRALDLSAMHDTAHLPIEGIASVHGRAIVPEQEIADAPPVHIPEIGALDMSPERIK